MFSVFKNPGKSYTDLSVYCFAGLINSFVLEDLCEFDEIPIGQISAPSFANKMTVNVI